MRSFDKLSNLPRKGSRLPIMVDHSGVTLATYGDGPSDAPWLVMANSLAATHAMWEPQMAALTAHYRVLRYDARGHGRSPATIGAVSLNDLAEDVLRVMDAHDVGQADLIGLSLGGTTALALAADHGSRFRRIVCCDANAESDADDAARWDRRIAAVATHGVASLVPELLARWYTPAFREARPDVMRQAEAMIRATNDTAYAACAAVLKTLDLFDRLPDIRHPVLYIAGAQDGVAPDRMRKMQADTPGSAFVLIDPGAHLPNMESAQRFNEAVLSFLRG